MLRAMAYLVLSVFLVACEAQGPRDESSAVVATPGVDVEIAHHYASTYFSINTNVFRVFAFVRVVNHTDKPLVLTLHPLYSEMILNIDGKTVEQPRDLFNYHARLSLSFYVVVPGEDLVLRCPPRTFVLKDIAFDSVETVSAQLVLKPFPTDDYESILNFATSAFENAVPYPQTRDEVISFELPVEEVLRRVPKSL